MQTITWYDSIVFTQPYYVGELSQQKNIPFAFWLMAQLKPRVVLELGLTQGDFYSAFCQIRQKLNLASKLYARVDDQASVEFAQFNHEHYQAFSQLLTAASLQNVLQEKPIDLLHINHSKDLGQDLATYIPYLSDQAIVLISNIHDHTQAWQTVIQNYLFLEFPGQEALGILLVGPHSLAILRHLAETNGPIKNAFLQFFMGLGRMNLAYAKWITQTQHYEHSQALLEEKKASLDFFETTVEMYKNELNLKNRVITQHQEELKLIQQKINKTSRWQFRKKLIAYAKNKLLQNAT